MSDYKMEAAKGCLQFIKSGQTIGLGAGTTITNLVDLISDKTELAATLNFVSSSFKTRSYLLEKGLKVHSAALIRELDCYFDGGDQFDAELNALKSGGGIHTSEKILAAMAKEFILAGDVSKLVHKLDHTYPLVIEILPEALSSVLYHLQSDYPDTEITLRFSDKKDGPVITENGNMLADIRFSTLPDLAELNRHVKMIPGVADHSLFYQMAAKAVIAGPEGIKIITPARFIS